MPDGDAGLLDILLGQGRRDAHLERGVDRVDAVLEAGVVQDGHGLEAGDEHAVRERLFRCKLATCSCEWDDHVCKERGG